MVHELIIPINNAETLLFETKIHISHTLILTINSLKTQLAKDLIIRCNQFNQLCI